MKSSLLLRNFLACCIAVIPIAATAITPEQIGTYSGTASVKRFQLSTVKPVAEKMPISLTLHADNSYTVNLQGEPFSSTAAAVGANHGSINFSTGGVHLNMTMHFAKDGIKGALQFYLEGGPELLEGKVVLRKDPL